jgi:hypothetical protein
MEYRWLSSKGLERLEPTAGKLARSVLREEGAVMLSPYPTTGRMLRGNLPSLEKAGEVSLYISDIRLNRGGCFLVHEKTLSEHAYFFTEK